MTIERQQAAAEAPPARAISLLTRDTKVSTLRLSMSLSRFEPSASQTGACSRLDTSLVNVVRRMSRTSPGS